MWSVTGWPAPSTRRLWPAPGSRNPLRDREVVGGQERVYTCRLASRSSTCSASASTNLPCLVYVAVGGD